MTSIMNKCPCVRRTQHLSSSSPKEGGMYCCHVHDPTRYVLVNQTPTVLQADIYAVAALAAGVVVVIGYVLHCPAFLMMTVGALLCFWLRVMAIYRGWHLPVARSQNQSG